MAAGSVAGAFVVMATLYSLVTPPWEAPDEVGHMRVVTHLAMHGTLPSQHDHPLGQAHQPPLYYVLAVLPVLAVDLSNESGRFRFNPDVAWGEGQRSQVNAALHGPDERFPYRGQVLALHLARGVSVLCGLFAVLATIGIGWALWPERPAIGCLAGALVAFNPQFLFISGAVSNESLAAATGGGTLWALVRALQAPERLARWGLVGVMLSAALLTKVSAAAIGVIVAGAIVVHALRRRALRSALVPGFAVGVVVIATTAWWFWRNQTLYGDLLGFGAYRENYATLLRTTPIGWTEAVTFVHTQFRSYWGNFGWLTVPAPVWFYGTMAALVMAAIAGLGRALAGRGPVTLSESQRRAVVLLVSAFSLQEAFIATGAVTFNDVWYQGRYLFGVNAAIVVLLSVGLTNLMPRSSSGVLGILTSVALAAIGLFMLFAVIQPAYAH